VDKRAKVDKLLDYHDVLALNTQCTYKLICRTSCELNVCSWFTCF